MYEELRKIKSVSGDTLAVINSQQCWEVRYNKPISQT